LRICILEVAFSNSLNAFAISFVVIEQNAKESIRLYITVGEGLMAIAILSKTFLYFSYSFLFAFLCSYNFGLVFRRV